MAAGLAAHVALVNADEVTTAIQHRGQPTVFRANSPYGRLVVTDDSGQLTFYRERRAGNLHAKHRPGRGDRPLRDEPASGRAARSCSLGGGVAGTAREILRYGV